MAKKSKPKSPKPRNHTAVAAHMRNSAGPMKDKRTTKGGSGNEEWKSELDQPKITPTTERNVCSWCFSTVPILDDKVCNHDWPPMCRALCHGVHKPPATAVQIADKCLKLLNSYFKDEAKSELWMETSNLLFGNIAPNTLIQLDRGFKVLDFIRNSLEENKR